jgi:hypothetical protein
MSYNPTVGQFQTWNSRETMVIDQLKVLVKDTLLARASAGNKVTNPVIRPLRAADLNTSFGDIFSGFTMNATAGSPSPLTAAGFTTQVGKAYAFFGLTDLTAGTKSVTAIQYTLSGVNFPLQPAVIAELQFDEHSTAYHSPVYATEPNQSLTINVFGTIASATVNLRLIGYIAESGNVGSVSR